MNKITWAISRTRSELCEVDARASAKELRVEAAARREARQQDLPDLDTVPSPTEIQIDHFHDALCQERTETLLKQLANEQGRQATQRRLAEQPGFDEIVEDVKQKAFEHRSAFRERADDLQAEAQRRQRDLNAFRSAAGLAREPIEPASPALHWAMLFAAGVLEALANTPLLSVGSRLGLVGGLWLALCIAALNISLGACAGVLMRFINHINWPIRALAAAFGLAYAGFLTTFHLGVAHYRNMLAGVYPKVSPEDAGRAALQVLLESPFELQTIEAWALVIIGVTAALAAAVGAYWARDPYPLHSKQTGLFRDAAAALRRHKDGYLIGLNAHFEGEPRRGGRSGVEARLQAAYQSALAAIDTHRASSAVTLRLQQQHPSLLSQIAASRTYCHARYRAVYRAVRQAAPARFAVPVPPSSFQPHQLTRFTPTPLDTPTLHAALDKGFAAAKAKARAVQREYLDSAAALFAEIGQTSVIQGVPVASESQAASLAAAEPVPATTTSDYAAAPADAGQAPTENVSSHVARLPWRDRLARHRATRMSESA